MLCKQGLDATKFQNDRLPFENFEKPNTLLGLLVFFTNLCLMEFQVGYLALLPLFSVIDDFEWFWMESLHKNIQLMLEFLKGTFLVLHFSC